jgi:hypothetical protein
MSIREKRDAIAKIIREARKVKKRSPSFMNEFELVMLSVRLDQIIRTPANQINKAASFECGPNLKEKEES